MPDQPLFHPFVGLALGRAIVAPADMAVAALGRPVWGPASLLADLAMRLGLPHPPQDVLTRLTSYREALANSDLGVFTASFRTDPLGTTRLILSMRDTLVEAGWQGEALTGSSRLQAFARLPLPLPGEADRLADVAAALTRLADTGASAAGPRPPYDALTLCEPRTEWPPLWRRLFGALEALGTAIDIVPEPSPSAPAHTDLGALQRLLAEGRAPDSMKGDGTFALVAAPTVEPLADALGAMIGALSAPDADSAAPVAAVIRTLDAAPLEAALAAHGQPRLGLGAPSSPPTAAAWLPLVLRLARAPFDPEAAIDLLLLGEHGLTRYQTDRLASALAEGPGLASSAFRRVAPEVQQAAPEAFERIMRWLTPIAGAATATEWSERLRALDDLLRRRALQRRRGALAAAHAGASRSDETPVSDLEEAIGDEVTATLGAEAATEALELARLTVDGILRALPTDQSPPPQVLDELVALLAEHTAVALSRREAGRLMSADAPAGLLGEVDHLIWWGFIAPVRPVRAFRESEIAALAARGIEVPDPVVRLRAEARAARFAILRARRTVVLALPERFAGEATAVHPLWSELLGRCSNDVLRPLRRAVDSLVPPTERVPRRALPPATSLWTVHPPPPRAEPPRLSVSGLERWLLCPLSQVLAVDARLRRRARGGLETGPALLGRIGHALVETLHREGALARPTVDGIERTLARILADEAAFLLAPGRAATARHLGRTFTRAVLRLAEVLAEEGLEVTGVEEEAALVLAGRPVSLRTDVRARDRDGRVVVIDLKWSTKSHRAALFEGRAIQLSAYAQALSGAPVAGAWYFGLMRADRTPLATAEVLGQTWHRVEHTFEALESALARGTVPVALDDAPPMHATLGLSLDRALFTQGAEPCRYCSYELVCGRAFQA